MEAKSSSVRTMSAASLATSVPVMPMATPMSACLSAGASLTPSPVMATTWPLDCSASTRRSFCSGVTLAKTLVLSASSMNSSSCTAAISEPVTAPSPAPTMPISWAIAAAVAAWSPVIIFTEMPAWWQASTAAMAAGRGGSIIACRPRKVRPPATSSWPMSSVPSGRAPRAKARTRRPSAASASTCAWTAAASSGTGSPAPSDRGRAALEHLLDGALHVHDPAALAGVVQRRHVLVRALEGDRVQARQRGRLVGGDHAGLGGARQQGRLGRVAGHLVAAVRLVERGVVAEQAGQQDLARGRGRGRARSLPPARTRRRSPGTPRRRPPGAAPSSRSASACRSCRCR